MFKPKPQFSKNPIAIGMAISMIALILILVLSALNATKNWTWKIAASALLFYSVASVILSLRQRNFRKYILRAFIAYLLMFFGLISLVWFLSDSVSEFGVYFSIIYPCLALFFIMLIGLAFLMRGMLQFVSGEHPSDFF